MTVLESTATHEEAASPTVDIELLALDLSTCTRCTGSLASIEAALALTRPVLDAAGVEVRVRERVIETEEQARHYRFLASPTIRVNDLDIAPNIDESHCDSCTDLCGCEEGTSCREWHYRGESHEDAPVGLIVEAIMRAAFRESTPQPFHGVQSGTYEGVPDNLKRFFEGTAAEVSTASCCEPAVQETCCEPAEKESCCGTGETQTCGCQ